MNCIGCHWEFCALCCVKYSASKFLSFSVSCLVRVSSAMTLNGRMTEELYIGKD
jgi:hypothetical protein